MGLGSDIPVEVGYSALQLDLGVGPRKGGVRVKEGVGKGRNERGRKEERGGRKAEKGRQSFHFPFLPL